MSDSIQNPILDVNGHRVPAIAYKRIVKLWRSGWTESEITEEARKKMRNTALGTISEVVLTAINDQKFAFTFSNQSADENYLEIPIDSPDTIQEAELALQETRASLARAELIEDKYALEAMKLMDVRPTFIEDARTPAERIQRQTHIDRMTKHTLQKRAKAEKEVLHLKEVEKIRQRLFALPLC